MMARLEATDTAPGCVTAPRFSPLTARRARTASLPMPDRERPATRRAIDLMEFIKTNPAWSGCWSGPGAAPLGRVCERGAGVSRSVVCWASLGVLIAVAVVSAGVPVPSGVSFQVSVLLLTCAALMRASASVAGEGTRALAPCVVRVGRPVGSAFAESGRPYRPARIKGQGDTVSLRHQSIPLLRVGR